MGDYQYDALAGFPCWEYNGTGTYGGDTATTRLPIPGKVLEIGHRKVYDTEPIYEVGNGRDASDVITKKEHVEWTMKYNPVDDDEANSILALALNGWPPNASTGVITEGATAQDFVLEYKFNDGGGTTKYRLITGCGINEYALEGPDGGPCVITISGPAKDYATSGSAGATNPTTKFVGGGTTSALLQNPGSWTITHETSMTTWTVPQWKFAIKQNAMPYWGSTTTVTPTGITVGRREYAFEIAYLVEDDTAMSTYLDSATAQQDITLNCDLNTHARYINIKGNECRLNNDFDVKVTHQCGERKETYKWVPIAGLDADVKYNA